MAKTYYSALINCIRGLLNNTIYQAYKGTEYIRQAPVSVTNPNTSRQQLIRTSISKLAKTYDSLTAGEKELWDSYAVMAGYHCFGQQTYIKFNMNISCADHPELTCISSPPATPGTPKHVQGFCVTPMSSLSNCISWTVPADVNTFVESYFRLHRGFCSISPCYGLCPTVGYRPSFRFVATCRADYGHIVHTHTWPVGTRLFFKVFSIDKYGRKSPRSHVLALKVPS